MIYYLGYYFENNDSIRKHQYLSSVNKMEYIIQTIDRLGCKHCVLSCCTSKSSTKDVSRERQLGRNGRLHFFYSFGQRSKVTKFLDLLGVQIQLLVYLIKNTGNSDTVLVYHSTSLLKVIPIAQKLKRFHLIIEAEEIYGDVSNDEKLKKREIRAFRSADGFVFPTGLLSQVINSRQKPYVLVHGTYHVEPDRNCSFDDEKIHVLYAGTLDPRKGGTMAAAAAAYLPENYHVHILGFGRDDDKQFLEKKIEEVSKNGNATVTYDGLLSGEDYIRFVQSCHIGLSPQNPDAKFNDTSFPSKVLSYMANGLRVVSVRIPAVEQSAVGDMIFYYDNQNPKEIAEAIMQVDLSAEYDSRKRIKQLDKKFSSDLKELIEGLENGKQD